MVFFSKLLRTGFCVAAFASKYFLRLILDFIFASQLPWPSNSWHWTLPVMVGLPDTLSGAPITPFCGEDLRLICAFSSLMVAWLVLGDFAARDMLHTLSFTLFNRSSKIGKTDCWKLNWSPICYFNELCTILVWQQEHWTKNLLPSHLGGHVTGSNSSSFSELQLPHLESVSLGRYQWLLQECVLPADTLRSICVWSHSVM